VYNDAAYVGCRVGVFKVLVDSSDKLMTPRCTGPAEVQVRYGLGFVALRAEISRSYIVFRGRRRVTIHD
jgi:hypothetical protein